MPWWKSILGALWLFLPAFVANMSPVFTAKLLPKWNTPIDFGAVHADGERALGNGKTWRGLLGGGFAGAVTALLMGLFPLPFVRDLDLGYSAGTPIWGLVMFGFVMGFAALAGDAIESFIKRRSGRPRGAPWFPFDQLDFVVAGLAAAFAFYPLLDGTWALQAYGTFWVLGTLLIGTPILHLTVNRVGYWLKLKEVPW